ncbi:MAG: ABC transporter ATP-binding protein [Deltaproteobacteria bacterium]|jgi:putative ABC transport system ATP-binding protein|nr:ABC transporter ATP-binding protein [Deltaproteobacteria bacterium]
MLMRLEAVSKWYPMGETRLAALQQVSLDIERGEYLSCIGPSGSGKSTLMHLLGCLDRPDAGSYWLDGERVEDLGDRELSWTRNRKIGFVFQSFYLISQLSVAENVELPLVYQGLDSARRREVAAELLEAVGLSSRLGHRPNELSGGECQRVAIARALVTGPDIILADEPTGNLDTRTGEEIMDLLEDCNRRGVTLVVVTHDLQKANRAQRVVQLRDGRIIGHFAGEQKQAALRELRAEGRPVRPEDGSPLSPAGGSSRGTP